MTCVTLRADLGVAAAAADEIRQRDRHRLDVALGDVDADHGAAPARRHARERAGSRAPISNAAAGQVQRRLAETISLMNACVLKNAKLRQPRNISRGSKVISMSFQIS